MIDNRCYRVRFEDREAGGAQRHRHHRISLDRSIILCCVVVVADVVVGKCKHTYALKSVLVLVYVGIREYVSKEVRQSSSLDIRSIDMHSLSKRYLHIARFICIRLAIITFFDSSQSNLLSNHEGLCCSRLCRRWLCLRLLLLRNLVEGHHLQRCLHVHGHRHGCERLRTYRTSRHPYHHGRC